MKKDAVAETGRRGVAKKLPRAQRQARHAARMQRQASKDARLSLRAALGLYGEAIVQGWVTTMAEERGLDLQRVICERCGLEQEYLNADNFPDDELDVYPCPGPLDLDCGSEICWSTERYLEAA
jgi:hypothetical protein